MVIGTQCFQFSTQITWFVGNNRELSQFNPLSANFTNTLNYSENCRHIV